MGEIADDMIDGICCSLCGQYFHDPNKPDELYEHGYPAVCDGCWGELNKKEKETHQKALVGTL